MNSVQLGKYYLDNKGEFSGETHHAKLLIGLKKFAEPVEGLVVGIDVGACIGGYLKNIEEMCPELGSQIICFEPNPQNIRVLEDKITDKNIKLFKHCISNETKTTAFYNWVGQPNTSGNGKGGLKSRGAKLCDIDVKPLDTVLDAEFAEKEICIKFIKIDTEGNDTNVIKSMKKYLPKTKYIIFECSDCLDDFRGPGIRNPMKDIVDFLSSNGFDTYRIGTKKLIKVNDQYWNPIYESVKFWSDCFAIKKDDPLIHKLINSKFDYIY